LSAGGHRVSARVPTPADFFGVVIVSRLVGGVPRRRRLRAAGDLRGAGDTPRGLRHPEPSQQEAGAGDREVSSGTRHRTNSRPPGGRHHGAITATEDVDRSAGSSAYDAADQ